MASAGLPRFIEVDRPLVGGLRLEGELCLHVGVHDDTLSSLSTCSVYIPEPSPNLGAEREAIDGCFAAG